MKTNEYNAVVVGGGFYGCSIAVELKKSCEKVLLVESESELLTRASYGNQARVHGGYHYPRSYLTGRRSRANLHRFSEAYKDSVITTDKMYYGIAREFSKVSAAQFARFCHQIEAPAKPAPADVKAWFNSDMIEEVFEVEEFVFDAKCLAESLKKQIENSGVEVRMQTTAEEIKELQNGSMSIRLNNEEEPIQAEQTWLCTYSAMNEILNTSSLPEIPLKHEVAELSLVDVPDFLKNVGITLMDGPFFSLYPFPAANCHSLSHVRFTPHHAWEEPKERKTADISKLHGDDSSFLNMQRDVQRFMPALADLKFKEPLWEIKTVLPRSEVSDSRPILFKQNHGLKNLYCVLGAKIDNIFDVTEQLTELDESA
jgi:glycine/D-amino acid oxidase-like deaminating enzyme